MDPFMIRKQVDDIVYRRGWNRAGLGKKRKRRGGAIGLVDGPSYGVPFY